MLKINNSLLGLCLTIIIACGHYFAYIEYVIAYIYCWKVSKTEGSIVRDAIISLKYGNTPFRPC